MWRFKKTPNHIWLESNLENLSLCFLRDFWKLVLLTHPVTCMLTDCQLHPRHLRQNKCCPLQKAYWAQDVEGNLWSLAPSIYIHQRTTVHVCIFIYECNLEVLCAIWGHKQPFFSILWVVRITVEINNLDQILWPVFSLVETYMQEKNFLSLFIQLIKLSLPEYCCVNNET